MGSEITDAEQPGQRLIFSVTGHVLGLADGRLFGFPPMGQGLRPDPPPAAAATDVPDEQATPTRNEEKGYGA